MVASVHQCAYEVKGLGLRLACDGIYGLIGARLRRERRGGGGEAGGKGKEKKQLVDFLVALQILLPSPHGPNWGALGGRGWRPP